MRAPQKPVLLAVAAALVALVGTVVAATALAFSAGTVHVNVVEKKPGGARVNLFLPAAAVPVGAKFLPERKRRELAAQLGPFLPAVKAASLELARTEDFSLVEVRERNERISIRVIGGSLFIDVDSDRESVRVSFPLKLVARLAADLEPLAPERVALLQSP
ncbi:MAG: hypothetical protein ACRD4D_03880 [Candidatus Acidiferrales bacterium]